MILVDSNIWIYFLDASAPEHAKVKTALPRALKGDLLVPTVVQMEVVHYLVSRLGAQAEPHVETFLTQEAEVEPLSGGITAEAARLLLAHRESGIGGRDACLLVTAKRRDAMILTHDHALAKAAKALGLRTADPAG